MNVINNEWMNLMFSYPFEMKIFHTHIHSVNDKRKETKEEKRLFNQNEYLHEVISKTISSECKTQPIIKRTHSLRKRRLIVHNVIN